MNLWIVALLIQAGINVVAAEIGHAATALPRRLAYLAAVLSMSVPIGKATAGGAGLLYAFDLLGPVCLLLGFSRFGAVWRDAACRRFFLTAGLLVVGWPLTTTLFGILRTGIMDPKFIALALMRGMAYLGVFLLLLSVGRTRNALSGMFMVGGVAIALICLCGVLQFQLQIDLDLYDAIGEPVAGNLSGNFGAGFMGLYRGAVGAWGAVSLTVLPIVFLPRRRWWMLSLPLAVLLLAGILISGSRQGILFGVLGLTVALLAVPWLPPAGRRAGMAVKAALLLSMLVVFGALTLQTLSRSVFGHFLIQRYMDSLRHPVAQAAEARNQLPGVIEQVLAHPDVLLFGTGIQAPAATPAPPGWPYRFVYLDSEIGWVLQQSGLPALLLYGLFVLAILVFLGVALPRAEADDRLVLAGVLLMTGVGILFSYGHFFLLHVHSSNAPIAAWLWATLGLGIGTAARTQAAGSAARTEAGERLINAMDGSEACTDRLSVS